MNCNLHCLASGSAGNCYVITASNDALVLEAGVNVGALLKAIDYEIDGVCGVLASHKHQDHAKFIPKVKRYFEIYGNADLAEEYPNVNVLQPKKWHKIGAFKVMPLEVEHGVPNYAYVIDHEVMGRLIFATDLTHFPYVIKEVNHLLIECNYVEEVVINNMLDNEDIRSQVNSHMELTKTIEAVSRLQNPLLKNVILCHLSSANADRKIITERFLQELEIIPKFATKEMTFDIGLYDF